MSNQRRQDRQASANPVSSRLRKEANGRQESAAERPSRNGQKKPSFDAERRELRAVDRLIKRFTQKSDAQETILQAFQELNWQQIIDDPLPGMHGQVGKERLRTTVKNLNRRQREQLLCFRVHRQGTAVAWEFRNERR